MTKTTHFQCDTITIVLGYKNTPQGELHPIMQQRANKAAEIAQAHQTPILCTGGWGVKFNQHPFPHALHVQRWLQNQGIAASQFLPYAASKNTYEDGKLCADIIRLFHVERINLVTSDFHMQRGFLWLRHFNPQLTINCFPAITDIAPEDFVALLEHEKRAIARFYQDFPETPPLDTLYDWQALPIPM